MTILVAVPPYLVTSCGQLVAVVLIALMKYERERYICLLTYMICKKSSFAK